MGLQLVVGRGGDNGCFGLGGLGVVEVCKVVYSLFGLALSHWGLYRKQPRGAQAFHHIAVAVLSVSTIAYYAMASDLGQTSVRTEFRSGPDRSIFVGFCFAVPVLSLSIKRVTAVRAVYSMVHQRTAHPPLITPDDWSPAR
jgi:bacteriorhodopsin